MQAAPDQHQAADEFGVAGRQQDGHPPAQLWATTVAGAAPRSRMSPATEVGVVGQALGLAVVAP